MSDEFYIDVEDIARGAIEEAYEDLPILEYISKMEEIGYLLVKAAARRERRIKLKVKKDTTAGMRKYQFDQKEKLRAQRPPKEITPTECLWCRNEGLGIGNKNLERLLENGINKRYGDAVEEC